MAQNGPKAQPSRGRARSSSFLGGENRSERGPTQAPGVPGTAPNVRTNGVTGPQRSHGSSVKATPTKKSVTIAPGHNGRSDNRRGPTGTNVRHGPSAEVKPTKKTVTIAPDHEGRSDNRLGATGADVRKCRPTQAELYQHRLAAMPEDEIVGPLDVEALGSFTLPKLRTRSKSLAVVDNGQMDQFRFGPQASNARRASTTVFENSQMGQAFNPQNSDTRHDGHSGGGQKSATLSFNQTHAPDAPQFPRRYSELGLVSEEMPGFDYQARFGPRRHSVAVPTSNRDHFADALGSLRLDDVAHLDEAALKSGLFASSLADYFDNRDSRAARVAAATASATFSNQSSISSTPRSSITRRQSVNDADARLGKGVPLRSLPQEGQLYIVEFKAGRSDIFYLVPECTAAIKKGDFVIVEADRGKDLGKVVKDGITAEQVRKLQQPDSERTNTADLPIKEFHPKRIFRPAQPSEVALLINKSQDESKALQHCQTRVRQKGLPMEVVDAEYQWDRKKLSFYFVAERRVDFRELVRELFKTYKTRIWMCAVNPNADPFAASQN